MERVRKRYRVTLHNGRLSEHPNRVARFQRPTEEGEASTMQRAFARASLAAGPVFLTTPRDYREHALRAFECGRTSLASCKDKTARVTVTIAGFSVSIERIEPNAGA